MLKRKNTPVGLILLFLLSCADNKTATAEKQIANNSPAAENREQTSASQDNDILGEWELLMWATDANDNKKLDDEERKKPITGAQDYMKLNSDGTCIYLVFKQKGRYEVKPDSDGRRQFTLIDVNNYRMRKGYIYSVTKDEFILLDGATFRIYKRL
ncbi:MAG TPA: hypothetical protein VJ765_00975 [Chitinophagaceae bacterium]|nr:hypothetical protein [Chitinophagaceae bacterium]